MKEQKAEVISMAQWNTRHKNVEHSIKVKCVQVKYTLKCLLQEIQKTRLGQGPLVQRKVSGAIKNQEEVTRSYVEAGEYKRGLGEQRKKQRIKDRFQGAGFRQLHLMAKISIKLENASNINAI